jgi:uncharacterized membrane protein YidH (DUF202 family)
MIARIFDNSKPINFIIAFSIVLMAFFFEQFKLFKGEFRLEYVLIQIANFALCLVTMALFNFIVNKNNLTQKKQLQNIIIQPIFCNDSIYNEQFEHFNF